MSNPSRAPDREQTFTALYESARPDLVAFVRRRSPDAGAVDDVVAEAFLVVWRRLDDLPRDAGQARAWLFGITRNVLLNAHRGQRRGHALEVRLADPYAVVDSDVLADSVAARVDLARAWRRLAPVHQEALALAVLDGLSSPHAAAVLGVSPVAFRLRLSRARKALRLHLTHQPSPAPAALAPAAGFSERTTR